MNTKSRGPGPAAYGLPTGVGFKNHSVANQRAPMYTFGTHHKDLSNRYGPGSGAYRLETINRYGNQHNITYSMRKKAYLQETVKSPGPAAHNVRLSPIFKGTKPPVYSLRAQTKIISRHYAPSPNTYNIDGNKIKQKAPAYTMRKITPVISRLCSPGPGVYPRPDLNVKKTKAPIYSMKGRNIFMFKKCTPGPDIYDLSSKHPFARGPTYAFGKKHGPYVNPMIVEGDNL